MHNMEEPRKMEVSLLWNPTRSGTLSMAKSPEKSQIFIRQFFFSTLRRTQSDEGQDLASPGPTHNLLCSFIQAIVKSFRVSGLCLILEVKSLY